MTGTKPGWWWLNGVVDVLFAVRIAGNAASGYGRNGGIGGGGAGFWSAVSGVLCGASLEPLSSRHSLLPVGRRACSRLSTGTRPARLRRRNGSGCGGRIGDIVRLCCAVAGADSRRLRLPELLFRQSSYPSPVSSFFLRFLVLTVFLSIQMPSRGLVHLTVTATYRID